MVVRSSGRGATCTARRSCSPRWSGWVSCRASAQQSARWPSGCCRPRTPGRRRSRVAVRQGVERLPGAEDSAVPRSCGGDYVAALTWVNDACDKNFTRVRSFRNVVLAASVGLAVVAIGLGVIGASHPAASRCASTPARSRPKTSAARAARSARSCARRVRSVVRRVATCRSCSRSASRPGRSPPRLAVRNMRGHFDAVLRAGRASPGSSCLPARSTALFGMLMLRGAFIPGLSALDNQGQIIAYSDRVRVRPADLHPHGRQPGPSRAESLAVE